MEIRAQVEREERLEKEAQEERKRAGQKLSDDLGRALAPLARVAAEFRAREEAISEGDRECRKRNAPGARLDLCQLAGAIGEPMRTLTLLALRCASGHRP